MPLDEGSKKVIDELRSGKYQLEPDQFYEVWEMFDKTGTGKIKVEDVEDCVRRLLSCINIPSFSPYQETISEALMDTLEHYVSVHHVTVLFPLAGDMFARHFQRAAARSTSCVVFIRIWREFDQDGDGQLDRNETIQLVKRLLAQQQQRIEDEFGVSRRQFYITDTELDVFVDTLFERGDLNGDGKLQLRELAELLNVEKNFLDVCPKSLQQKEMEEIFAHYDRDASGVVEGPEFLAFVRDVLRMDQKPLSRMTRKESDVDAEELELAGSIIMGLVDDNNDGKLDRAELGVVMQKKKSKLIKHQTQFLKMQESFDKGEM